MAVISWGQPKIWIKKLATGATYQLLPTPVEDSTQLETTKGDKVEAKIEGGENEDVRVKRSTYALMLNIRKAKARVAPIASSDGLVTDNYEVILQPEDPDCPGFKIDKTTVSIVDSYTAADGAIWEMQFDALKPDSGATVKWGVVSGTTTPSFHEGLVGAPEFSPAEWTEGASLTVELTCATDGASIYYTQDGSDPTSASTAYNPTNKITLSATKTLKAIAIKGSESSVVSSKTYTKPA